MGKSLCEILCAGCLSPYAYLQSTLKHLEKVATQEDLYGEQGKFSAFGIALRKAAGAGLIARNNDRRCNVSKNLKPYLRVLVVLPRTEDSTDFFQGGGPSRLRMVEAMLTGTAFVHHAESSFMHFFRDVCFPNFGVHISAEDLAFAMMLVSIVRNYI
jgi:hypothetical protein